MRQYNIVTRILLILSIIDFVLAAPVLVQEKHQASVDVLNIPRNVTTVFKLGKRWDEELEKLGEEYFESSGKSIDSSGTYSSSSTAPSGPDHGSTNVVQPPAPYSASSTTSSDQLIEPSCSPSSSSKQGLSARGNSWGKNCLDLLEAMSAVDITRPGPMLHTPTYGPYHQLPAMEPPSMELMRDPNFDWDSWINAEEPSSPPTPPRPKLSNGQASEYGPGPPPTGLEPSWTGPPPTEFYSTTVGPSPLPDGPEAGWRPSEPEHEVVGEPPTSPDSELHPDHQSLSAGAQPADLLAAIYAAKGKAKESRGISGIARDVKNAAQRELEPPEWSLDPRE